MPWKVDTVSNVRFALCHAVRTLSVPVARVAREFGVSRKTAHKWLKVFDQAATAAGSDGPDGGAFSADSAAAAEPGLADPSLPAVAGVNAADLADRSRRPHLSPRKTDEHVERQVLGVRDLYNWGPRKIHAFLTQQAQRDGLPPLELPSARTLAAVLARNGRVAAKPDTPQPQRFERDAPNQLWQLDHKGPIEVARKKVTPLTIIDDHSRYCLAFQSLDDKTMASAFDVLWNLLGDAGLPDGILCDNAFNTMGIDAPGLSWFDSRLIRLGIRPAHGRPYHPQTQGKVERFHGSAVREFVFFNARRDLRAHFDQDIEHWRNVYNTLRPHEALGDQPPVTRWRPAERKRPPTLPEPEYEPGQLVRKIGSCGEVSFKGYKILVGRGLVGDRVRVEEHQRELRIFYCQKQIRSLSTEQLVRGKML